MISKLVTKSFSSFRVKFNFSTRVRYAPSPTGPLHIGGVRTALFNYLYAKKNGGKFIVRIQDTDQERHVPGSMEQIFSILKWLGIEADQSIHHPNSKYQPYIQSERLSLYKQMQRILLKSGMAYPCFCPPEKGKRKNTKGQTEFWYDGTCRKLTLEQVKEKIRNKEPYSVRIKSDISEFRVENFEDKVFGKVAASQFDDFILVKQNGWPTFHFANVIDDWKMDITHVIRGQQWLTNTSKHLYLYKVFGQKPPVFMHLPVITGKDGKKLSKRDPTAPIKDIIDKGYQKQAIINFIGLLGFTPASANQSNQEKLNSKFTTLEDLRKQFSTDKITKNPIQSDLKKLNHYNRYYLRKKWEGGNQQFIEIIIEKFRELHQAKEFSDTYIKDSIDCIVERLTNYEDLTDYGYFFSSPSYLEANTIKDIEEIFGKPIQISENKYLFAEGQKLRKNQNIIHNLLLIFEHVISPSQYNDETIAKCISQFLYDNKNEIKNEEVYHLLRLCVTGHKSGPNIIKTCRIIGKDETIKRINHFKNQIIWHL